MCRGKKFFLQRFWQKISYPNQITHTPSPLKKNLPLIKTYQIDIVLSQFNYFSQFYFSYQLCNYLSQYWFSKNGQSSK